MTPGLYLLCANDYLETAFFCGTASECTEVLELKNLNTFYSMISKGAKFCGGFITVEKIKLEKLNVKSKTMSRLQVLAQMPQPDRRKHLRNAVG